MPCTCPIPADLPEQLVDALLQRLPHLAQPPLKRAASAMSKTVMVDILTRLHRTIRYPLVPCCVDRSAAVEIAAAAAAEAAPPDVYSWGSSEDDADEIKRSCAWVQQHLAPSGVAVLAVQSRTWLRAQWASEDIVIGDSRTDFVFIPSKEVPARPAPCRRVRRRAALLPTATETQLLSLLPSILGLYETKTTDNLTGE
jgi:hypothetical protein